MFVVSWSADHDRCVARRGEIWTEAWDTGRRGEACADVYWAGFREKDCSGLTPTLVVAQAPAKGEVNFKPNQNTMIRHSNSGKCIGTSLVGTGIYYTAKAGSYGDDTFSVTATTPDGSTATKTFNVKVME